MRVRGGAAFEPDGRTMPGGFITQEARGALLQERRVRLGGAPPENREAAASISGRPLRPKIVSPEAPGPSDGERVWPPDSTVAESRPRGERVM